MAFVWSVAHDERLIEVDTVGGNVVRCRKNSGGPSSPSSLNTPLQKAAATGPTVVSRQELE